MKHRWLALVAAVVALTLACSDSDNPQSPERSAVEEESSPTAEPEGRVGVALTEEQFRSLLTVQEVQEVLKDSQDLREAQFLDIGRLIGERGVQQTFPMDSGYSIFFVNHDETKSIKLGVFDLESPVAASNQYEEVKDLTTPELEVMTPPIGHASAQMVANAAGIGSNIVFLRSDLLVTLHTGMPTGAEPLTDIAGLRELAELIDRRLRRN